jgi:hypothetical protein
VVPFRDSTLIFPSVTIPQPWHAGISSYFSATWATANLAVYWPFAIQQVQTVYKFFWINGSAAGNNADVGIFDSAGVKLISTGSTAMTGNNALQVTDVADTVLTPGIYYFGFSHSSTTANRIVCMGASSAGHQALLAGMRTETSALPLPSTATLTTLHAGTQCPAAGAQTRSTWL